MKSKTPITSHALGIRLPLPSSSAYPFTYTHPLWVKYMLFLLWVIAPFCFLCLESCSSREIHSSPGASVGILPYQRGFPEQPVWNSPPLATPLSLLYFVLIACITICYLLHVYWFVCLWSMGLYVGCSLPYPTIMLSTQKVLNNYLMNKWMTVIIYSF